MHGGTNRWHPPVREDAGDPIYGVYTPYFDACTRTLVQVWLGSFGVSESLGAEMGPIVIKRNGCSRKDRGPVPLGDLTSSTEFTALITTAAPTQQSLEMEIYNKAPSLRQIRHRRGLPQACQARDPRADHAWGWRTAAPQVGGWGPASHVLTPPSTSANDHFSSMVPSEDAVDHMGGSGRWEEGSTKWKREAVVARSLQPPESNCQHT